jgi:hypothetical protein
MQQIELVSGAHTTLVVRCRPACGRSDFALTQCQILRRAKTRDSGFAKRTGTASAVHYFVLHRAGETGDKCLKIAPYIFGQTLRPWLAALETSPRPHNCVVL